MRSIGISNRRIRAISKIGKAIEARNAAKAPAFPPTTCEFSSPAAARIRANIRKVTKKPNVIVTKFEEKNEDHRSSHRYALTREPKDLAKCHREVGRKEHDDEDPLFPGRSH